MMFLTKASVDQIISNHAVLRSEPISSRQPVQTIDPKLELAGSFQLKQSQKKRRHAQSGFRISQRNSFFIRRDSWLSRIGISGSIGFYATEKFLYQSIWLSFGFRLPFELLSKIVSVELITCHLDSYWSDIHISSGRVRVRNMVPRDTKFLQACLRADLHLVRWHLENGTGNINDIDCNGASPLHVSL